MVALTREQLAWLDGLSDGLGISTRILARSSSREDASNRLIKLNGNARATLDADSLRRMEEILSDVPGRSCCSAGFLRRLALLEEDCGPDGLPATVRVSLLAPPARTPVSRASGPR